MKEFRTLTLAIRLYHQCLDLKLPIHLKGQILKSSSSVALNLSEGRAKLTKADQVRFFSIAMGSLRETCTILILSNMQEDEVYKLANVTSAHLYKLIRNAK